MKPLPIATAVALAYFLTTLPQLDGAPPAEPPQAGLAAWHPAAGWESAGDVALDPAQPGALVTRPGQGVLVSGGKAADLIHRQPHGDALIDVEFNIPRGSNSGIYVMGSYEVQIFDSFGVAKGAYPGIECGGIYPEWIGNANVRGHSPTVNASRPPGEWQSVQVSFRAPRFDANGKKIANARFERVIHNGRVVHEGVDLPGPTRGGLPEQGRGPLRLQGDHGPVAFRKVSVRPLADAHLALSWAQTATSLELRNGGRTVWRACFDPKDPKPFVHPLATVDGEVLTAFRPADHVWHHGLWFSWKYINGLNYWEENPKTGQSQGRTELTAADAAARPDYSATLTQQLSYHPPGKPALMTERRTLVFGKPDASGGYAIDWTGEFAVGAEPVVLDRTPPPTQGGPGWGGYAGLSLRFPPGIKGWSFTTSEGIATAAEGHGKPAKWVDFSSPAAGVTIIDLPANPRHPAPWYLSDSLPFFGPSPLFSEPMKLAAGERFTLRYRVVVHGPGGRPGT
jgi:hypothetical protein